VLPAHATVVDLVYRPRITALLEAASRRGLRTVDGTGMLVHQGALALERWLGVEAPTGVMRAALDRALSLTE
jgi:shikimate dehydrogenase